MAAVVAQIIGFNAIWISFIVVATTLLVTGLLLHCLGFRLAKVTAPPTEVPGLSTGSDWQRIVNRLRLLRTQRRLFGLAGIHLQTVPRTTARRLRQGRHWSRLGAYLDRVKVAGGEGLIAGLADVRRPRRRAR